MSINTHDSESRGQEEAGRTRRMSVLFTGSTAVKFVDALNKPPLKLSLSYQRLSTFLLYRTSNPTMEEIGATNPEYQPLRVLWHRSCAHIRKTIPLAPIHSFTKQIVPSMYQESLSWSRLISITRVFRNHLINSPLPSKIF